MERSTVRLLGGGNTIGCSFTTQRTPLQALANALLKTKDVNNEGASL